MTLSLRPARIMPSKAYLKKAQCPNLCLVLVTCLDFGRGAELAPRPGRLSKPTVPTLPFAWLPYERHGLVTRIPWPTGTVPPGADVDVEPKAAAALRALRRCCSVSPWRALSCVIHDETK